MSWKKFGGTDKLDKMNMMNVNYIATDALSTSSPYVGDFDINGELTVYNKSFLKNDTDISGNVFISENVKISKNVDLSGDLTIDGEIISTQSISMTDGVFTGNVSILDNTHLGNSIYYDATFIQGENQNPYGFIKGVGQSIGINTYTPEYTVDISSGSHLFRSYTNNVSGESILIETNSHQPLAKNTVQLESDPSMIGMRFGYKGDTVGNIFMNENKFAIHTASYIDISSDNMTIGKHKTNMDNSSVQFERLTVYDNATTNYLNDSESLLGQSIACIASDNSSVTFVSLTTPNQVGVHVGGGVYPTDKSKAYGALTLHENEIPSISLLQGDHFVQNRTTIGINTYKPKVNKYALDINGPVHIENGQTEKTLVSSFEIKTFTKSNKPTSTITTYGTPSTLSLDLSASYYIKSYYVSNTNGENWDKGTVITGEEDFNTSKNAILCAYTYIDNSNNRTHLIAGEGGYIFKKQYTDLDWVFIGGQSVTYKGVWTSNSPYYYTCIDPTENNINPLVNRISKNPTTNSLTQITTYARAYMNIPGLTTVNAMNGFTYTIGNNPTDTIYVDTLFVVGVSGIYYKTGWSSDGLFDLVSNTNTKTYYDVAVYYNLVTTTHHVIAVGDDIISVSINNGATWTHTSLTGMWKSVFISSTYAVIGGNGGSIKYSAYPYTVWNDIPESILNSSGNRSLLSNVNIQNILMPDANTLLLHSTPIPFQDISGSSQNTTGSSSIYYCYLPQLFNPYDDFVFDISGSTHLDGDVFIKRNLHTKNMATFEGNVDSTTYTNGTVTVIGGIGIEGNANIHKNIDIGKTAIIRNNDASENTLVVIGNTLTTGHANITGNMDVSNIRVLSTVDACLNAYPFGACIVNGGIGIQKNAYVGNSLHVANTITTPQLIINGDDAINYSTGAIQLIGGMGILGNLFVKDLTVIGNTRQDNNTDLNSLNISSDINATDTSSGAVIIAGGTAIKKDIYIGGNSYLLQNVRVFDNLDVSKNVTVDGSSHFIGEVIMDTSVNFLQNQTVNGNVIVQGNSIVNNLLDVSFARVRGRFDVSGNVVIDGNATIKSNVTINQNIRTYGTMDISNIVTITHADNAVKNGSVGSLHTYGGAMVKKDLIVYGNVDVSNTLIANSIQLNGANATSYRTGAIQLIGGMGISGELFSTNIVSDRIDVSNLRVLTSVIIHSTTESNSVTTGALTISGGVGIGKDINVRGNALVRGNTQINGNTDICGNTATQYASIGKLRVRGELDISGTTTIDATLKINSNQTVRGTMDICGNTTLSAFLDASFGKIRGYWNTFITDSSSITVTNTVDVSGQLTVGKLSDLSSVRVRSLVSTVVMDASHIKIRDQLDISGNLRVDRISDLSSVRVRSLLSTVVMDASHIKIRDRLDLSGQLVVDGMSDLSSARIRSKLDVVDVDASNVKVLSKVDISGQLTVVGMSDLSSARIRTRLDVVDVDASNVKVLSKVDISGQLTVVGMSDLSSAHIRSRLEVLNLDVSNVKVFSKVDISGQLIVDGMSDLSYARIRSRLDVGDVDASNVKVLTKVDISGQLTVVGMSDLSSVRVRSKVETVNLDASNIRVTTAIDVSGNVRVDGYTDLSWGTVQNTLDVSNLEVQSTNIWKQLDVVGNCRIRTALLTNMDASFVHISLLDVSGNMTVDGYSDLSGARIRNKLDVSYIDISNGRVTNNFDISGQLTVGKLSDLSSVRIRSKLDVVDVDASNVKVLSKVDISGQLAVVGMSDLSSARIRSKLDVGDVDASNVKVLSNVDISGQLKVVGMSDLSSARIRSRLDVGDVDASNVKVLSKVDISGQLKVVGMSDLSSARIRSKLDVGDVDASNVKISTSLDVSGNVRMDGPVDLSFLKVRNRVDISGIVRVDGLTDLSFMRVRNRVDISGVVRIDGNMDLSYVAVRNKLDVSGNMVVDGVTDLSYTKIRRTLDLSGMDVYTNIADLNYKTSDISKPDETSLEIDSNVTVPSTKTVSIGGQNVHSRFNNIEETITYIDSNPSLRELNLGNGDCSNVNLKSTVKIVLDAPVVQLNGNIDANTRDISNVKHIYLNSGSDIKINNVSIPGRISSLETKTLDFEYEFVDDIGTLTIGKTAKYDYMNLISNQHLSLTSTGGNVKFGSTIDASKNSITNVNTIDASNINVRSGGTIKIGEQFVTAGLLESNNIWKGDMNRFNIVTASGYLSVSGEIVSTGDISAGGHVKVKGNLDISGNSRVQQTMDMSSALVRNRLTVRGDCSFGGNLDASYGSIRNLNVANTYDLSGRLGNLTHITNSLYNSFHSTDGVSTDTTNPTLNIGWNGLDSTNTDNYSKYIAVRATQQIALRATNININANMGINATKTLTLNGHNVYTYLTDISGRTQGISYNTNTSTTDISNLNIILSASGNIIHNGNTVFNGDLDMNNNTINDVSSINVNNGGSLTIGSGGSIIVGGTTFTSGSALLSSSNSWTGSTNTFNNEVIIGTDTAKRVVINNGNVTIDGYMNSISYGTTNYYSGINTNIKLLTFGLKTDNTWDKQLVIHPTDRLDMWAGNINIGFSGTDLTTGITGDTHTEIRGTTIICGYNANYEFSKLNWVLYNSNYSIYSGVNETDLVYNIGWKGDDPSVDSNFVKYMSLSSSNSIGLKAPNIVINGNLSMSSKHINNVSSVNVDTGGSITIGGVAVTAGLLSSSNSWTGSTNTFNNEVIIGTDTEKRVVINNGNVDIGGNVTIDGYMNSISYITTNYFSGAQNQPDKLLHLGLKPDGTNDKELVIHADNSLCMWANNIDIGLDGTTIMRGTTIISGYNVNYEFSKLGSVVNNNYWNTYWGGDETGGRVYNIGWNGQTASTDSNYEKYIALRAQSSIGLRATDIMLRGNVSMANSNINDLSSINVNSAGSIQIGGVVNFTQPPVNNGYLGIIDNTRQLATTNWVMHNVGGEASIGVYTEFADFWNKGYPLVGNVTDGGTFSMDDRTYTVLTNTNSFDTDNRVYGGLNAVAGHQGLLCLRSNNVIDHYVSLSWNGAATHSIHPFNLCYFEATLCNISDNSTNTLYRCWAGMATSTLPNDFFGWVYLDGFWYATYTIGTVTTHISTSKYPSVTADSLAGRYMRLSVSFFPSGNTMVVVWNLRNNWTGETSSATATLTNDLGMMGPWTFVRSRANIATTISLDTWITKYYCNRG